MKALDPNVLQELRDLDDSGEFLREMASLFLNGLPLQTAQIFEAVSRGDFKKAAQVAHQLKSTSGNLGALELSRICGELEAFTDWNNKAAIDRLSASLQLELDNARAELESLKEAA